MRGLKFKLKLGCRRQFERIPIRQHNERKARKSNVWPILILICAQDCPFALWERILNSPSSVISDKRSNILHKFDSFSKRLTKMMDRFVSNLHQKKNIP